MDARNPAARREIAALADLTGAVRLPSGAHQQAAGTKVVTDLLIFPRREAAPARGLAWTAAPDQARAAETGPRSRHPDGHLEAHRDGTFTQVAQGHAIPFGVPGTQAGELRHLLRVRDAVTGLLDAEAASREDTPGLGTLRRDL